MSAQMYDRPISATHPQGGAVVLVSCLSCGAVVVLANTFAHDQWHDRIDPQESAR